MAFRTETGREQQRGDLQFPFRQRGDLQFPWKLHLLLEQAEKSGQDHIISWLPDGRAFRINDKEAFSEELMQTCFSSSKFKSFQRSLNLWGFETVSRGPDKGVRFHKHFVKGEPDLCRLMTRTKVKGSPKAFEEVSQGHPASDCIPRSTAPYNATLNAQFPNSLICSNEQRGNDGIAAILVQRQQFGGHDLSGIFSQISTRNPPQGMSRGGWNNSNPSASLDHMLNVSRLLTAAQNNVDSSQRGGANIFNSLATIQSSLNSSATLSLAVVPQLWNTATIVDFVANQILAQGSSHQLGGNPPLVLAGPTPTRCNSEGATNIYGV
jgi:hypothetical protein